MNLLRHLPRFQRAYRDMDLLAARERWSRSNIEGLQLERVNTVWRHAVAHVPYYRELRAARRLPARFSNLDEFRSCVPTLSKRTVAADPRRFLSERAAPGQWRATSGSTGEPLRAYWDTQSHCETLRAKYRFYRMWNIDIFDPMVYLWGRGQVYLPGVRGRAQRVRQDIEDHLRNRLRLSAYSVGDADLRAYLVEIARFRPRSLYGYSTAIELLARCAVSERFQCDSIRLTTLTAETATSEMVRVIEAAFRTPAVMEYGSCECGVFAHEWPDRKVHVREDIVMVETPARTDGLCDILVSVLTNSSFPLLRYEIGDTTDHALEVPSYGFAALQSVVGRSNDFVLTRRGRRIHYTRFKHLLDNSAGVRRFQVKQHADGFVSLHLEMCGGWDRSAFKRMQSTVEGWLDGFGVDVIPTRSLPLPQGKHRWLVSTYTGSDRNSLTDAATHSADLTTRAGAETGGI